MFLRFGLLSNLTQTSDLLTQSPPPRPEPPKVKAVSAAQNASKFEMTEEEEQELAELLDSD